MESIMQKDNDCFLCNGPSHNTHHVIYGTANRKLSDKYGLTVRLCYECHGMVHEYPLSEQAIGLKTAAQVAFIREYPKLDFRKIFGRNYL